jgi:Flp pilus assembly protein TadD
MARLAVAAAVATMLGTGAVQAASARGELREQWEFGIEMARRGAWKEALFRFRRSVEIDPDNALLRNNLAVAFESIGDYRSAGREYRRALELDPKNERIRTNHDSFQTFYGDLLEEDAPHATSPAAPGAPE